MLTCKAVKLRNSGIIADEAVCVKEVCDGNWFIRYPCSGLVPWFEFLATSSCGSFTIAQKILWSAGIVWVHLCMMHCFSGIGGFIPINATETIPLSDIECNSSLHHPLPFYRVSPVGITSKSRITWWLLSVDKWFCNSIWLVTIVTF